MRLKKRDRGPTTVVLERDLIDAVDAYSARHPLRPGRRYVVAAAIEHFLNYEANLAALSSDKR